MLAAANPKNGTLTVAAAASIAGTGVSSLDQWVALAVFVLVGSLGVLAPLAVVVVSGEAGHSDPRAWRHWFLGHNTAIMAVLFFVIGAKLIGDGIGIVT